jgi:hypothetical protein
MRLLDLVAHAQAPLVLALDGARASPFEVTGPSDCASQIADCSLRFVLADDLTRASAELAFADGARLADCLDLMRIPAQRLWIEWNDDAHQQVIAGIDPAVRYDASVRGRRVGVLLTSDAQGQAAVLRTFWIDRVTDAASEVIMSPLETHIDLRGNFARESDLPGLLSGGLARVTDRIGKPMTAILERVRFRFDNRWATYYRAAATSLAVQQQVVLGCLAAVARDAPFLLGFFLLLSAKDATRPVTISRTSINRKRQSLGRRPLLDHIELNACLEALPASDHMASGPGGRQSPRLHHVRGHLVRRDNEIFWRVPHLRGSAARGTVRSRTVCLSFARRS